MEFFKILQKKSAFFYCFLILASLINGLWNNALLLLINNKINGTPLPYLVRHPLPVFILLIIISYTVSRIFQLYMMRLTLDMSYEMVIGILRKVRFASYENFQRFGREKVYSLLGDTQTVSGFPARFIEMVNSAIMFCVGLGYLFWISVPGSLTVFGILILLAALYYRQTKVAERYLKQTRELSDAYHKNINDLLQGFKESKMSVAKGENLFRKLNENRVKVKQLNFITSVKWMNNDLLGRYCWFLLIGIILFVLPSFYSAEPKVLTTFIITLLFLVSPVGSLISMIPTISNIRIALRKLRQFDLEVDFSDINAAAALNSNSQENDSAFRNLTMKNIAYNYTIPGQEDTFSVNVPEFKVSKGELIFITGGNGSGKTTFINILTGLFKPAEGEIRMNGQHITAEQYPAYRNRFAAVFSDHYLFSENYENFTVSAENSDLTDFIAFMKLENIIRINEKENKLEIELSRGQQKRLSMIYALLEKKDILVLDEWAADQDPHFRAYFYKTFLGYLKEMGKTIIMVTHDDFYYRYADRIIKFDFGRIISEEIVQQQPIDTYLQT